MKYDLGEPLNTDHSRPLGIQLSCWPIGQVHLDLHLRASLRELASRLLFYRRTLQQQL